MTIKKKIVEISNKLRLSKEGENTFAKYDYFRPDDILKALNPLLDEYGLFMSFNLPYNKEKAMYEGTLYFEDLEDEKQNITYKFDIPLTSVKGASEAQGAGATMTYAKRYSIMNAFSIADNSDDLDAKKPSEIKKESQLAYNNPFGEKDGVCPECGAVAKYREGVKNGKKWQGWFCTGSKEHKPVWGGSSIETKLREAHRQADLDAIKEQSEKDIPIVQDDEILPEHR